MVNNPSKEVNKLKSAEQKQMKTRVSIELFIKIKQAHEYKKREHY